HGELVLQEAGGPVEQVPVGDDVERVEEAGDRLGVAYLVPGRLAEPELVEGGDRERVEQPTRRGRRDPEPGVGREGRRPGYQLRRQVVEAGVVAAGEDAPAH